MLLILISQLVNIFLLKVTQNGNGHYDPQTILSIKNYAYYEFSIFLNYCKNN